MYFHPNEIDQPGQAAGYKILAEAFQIGTNSIKVTRSFFLAHGEKIAIRQVCETHFDSKRGSVTTQFSCSFISDQKRRVRFRSNMKQIHQGRSNLGERELTIEDDVWIGTETSILPSVELGLGLVRGVGSIITPNILSNVSQLADQQKQCAL